MKKSEILNLGKELSKTYFKKYLKANNGDFGILNDDVITIGFYTDEKRHEYRMIFEMEQIKGAYVVVTHSYNKEKPVVHCYLYVKTSIK